MFLVLASIADTAAASFASDAAARLFTCADLATHPMSVHHPDLLSSHITVGGREVGVGEVEGVVNLLPVVLPDELNFYPHEEREYQAAELQALLTFLLSALPCPVTNRPSPMSLSGGCGSPLAWMDLAHSLGIGVSSLALDSAWLEDRPVRARDDTDIVVGCLGGAVIAPSDTAADRMTLDLSRAARVEYLRVDYERDGAALRFRSARTVPDVRDAATRAALARRLS